MGKKFKEAVAKVDAAKKYTLVEALELIDQLKFANFDETVDLSMRLGIDPKQSDQMVRGSVKLPHGLGKEVRVIVFAKGDKEKEAIEAGADKVGGAELMAEVEKGWMDFDKVVATPDMMAEVSKLGKVLGPRGLMPNPKLGTVTFEVAQAIADLKKGKGEYRAEKAGVVHVSVGKASFGKDKLKDNILAVVEAIFKAKPQSSKGVYFCSSSVSTTMGPGVKIDSNLLQSEAGF
jgi:large subunit ribosomal protein L1